MPSHSTLKSLFQRIVETGHTPETAQKILTEIGELLSIVTTPNEQENHKKDIVLNGSVAVNTNLAGKCFQDYLRTYQFMSGTYSCVKDKLKDSDRPIQLLYAGTGPYATIVLPLLFLFSSDEVQITALEINSTSYQLFKQFIKQIGKEDWFKHTANEDALLFSSNTPFDIIVSETMDSALYNEPQSAIFSHLLPFLKPDGNLIPQEIKLDMVASSVFLEKNVDYNCITDTQTRDKNWEHRQFIDTIVRVNKRFFEGNKLEPNQELLLKKSRVKVS